MKHLGKHDPRRLWSPEKWTEYTKRRSKTELAVKQGGRGEHAGIGVRGTDGKRKGVYGACLFNSSHADLLADSPPGRRLHIACKVCTGLGWISCADGERIVKKRCIFCIGRKVR